MYAVHSFVLLSLCSAVCAQDVIVAVDMDAQSPGIQQFVEVPAGTQTVQNIAVYIWDESALHSVYAIGCDTCFVPRGIVFGHHRDQAHSIGNVTSMIPHLGTPAVAGADHAVFGFPVQQIFGGASVEYFANMGQTAGSGALPIAPLKPQFTVEVRLANATAGDVFSFYLCDGMAVFGAGNFSVAGPFAFDAGGDAVPDLTRTLFGVDVDIPILSPPARFQVDYRDGLLSGGGATIVIEGCYADCDQSTGIGVLDLFDFLCFQNSFVLGEPYACDCDTSTGQLVCDLFDFLCFQDAFVGGCP